MGSAARGSSGLEILCPQKHWENMAKESRDQWGRRVLRPCPFCGGQGSQPNGKVFVNITHKPDCWILKRHEYYGGMTRVDEDDSAWNERAADSSANQFGGLESFNGDDLIMSATAYYLGRQTISVDAHCECLVRAWPRLSDNVREYIERIVENAFAKEACMAAMGKKISELGDACDRESWCKVRKCWTEKTSG